MLRRSMGVAAEGLRGDAMQAAFQQAVGGRPERLYTLLGISSGLPGTRVNLTMAQAFAVECMGRGKAADKLLLGMCMLSPEVAPGATEHEFLPVCGVLALGSRAASDKEPELRKKALPILHALSEDMRFRVRDIVPIALGKMGANMGDALVHEFASWTDGFFQGAAALLAMAQPNFLPVINDVDAALARLDEAYALAKNAPRSTARYPGFKALIDALGIAPAALATRFGVPVFDHLAAWSNTEMPELRGAIETAINSGKLTSRYAQEVKRVRAALVASIPPPRDPTMAVKGMRSRGKKHSRR